MSRSYKKTPYAGQRKCKFSKNYSNRKIRKTEEQRTKVADGGAFKKVMEPWDICGYKHIETWGEFQQRLRACYQNYLAGTDTYLWLYYCSRYKINRYLPNWEKFKQIWAKTYKRK